MRNPIKKVPSFTPFTNALLSVQASILIGSFVIAIAILLSGGILQLKNKQLGLGQQNTAAPVVKASDAPQEEDGNGTVKKVSLDDDPILGDKNAKLTMVEFSDYECPFCKRYFTQTYPQLKKDYIDTGKLKVVFRDLPLSFHQNAHKEAEAANCAREQGGDSAYFKYHDEMFTKTTSNGTGLSLEQLPTLAANIGLNGSLLQQCLDSKKYEAEVDKDLADADSVGATGTPTFFIGKSATGAIEGTMLVGAQPFSAFKTIIDQMLSQ
jgi:protein-disulfide isomerase